MRSRLAVTLCLALGLASHAYGESSRVPLFHRTSNVSLRKRLHINDLITEPGTVEIDWGTLYSYTSSGFTMPSSIKFTPAGDALFVGRTEYSASFDSIASAVITNNRATQFSERLTFAATSVLLDTMHFDIAIAPQATVLLRNGSGARLGATVIGRFDWDGNSLGVTSGWSAATHGTDANPAGVWDWGVGFGCHLASKGFWKEITPHANLTLEKATRFNRTSAIFGGVEYQITDRFALDFSGQRQGLTGNSPDRQLLVGMTLNLGKPQ